MTLSLLGGIHHVAIIASDYERSRHFYHQVLGLPILAETLREATPVLEAGSGAA